MSAPRHSSRMLSRSSTCPSSPAPSSSGADLLKKLVGGSCFVSPTTTSLLARARSRRRNPHTGICDASSEGRQRRTANGPRPGIAPRTRANISKQGLQFRATTTARRCISCRTGDRGGPSSAIHGAAAPVRWSGLTRMPLPVGNLAGQHSGDIGRRQFSGNRSSASREFADLAFVVGAGERPQHGGMVDDFLHPPMGG